jgi:hypothetical protein
LEPRGSTQNDVENGDRALDAVTHRRRAVKITGLNLCEQPAEVTDQRGNLPARRGRAIGSTLRTRCGEEP